MQEKLIDILSRATAWMTAAQIADAGGWRSHSNVGVALGQIEKATGTVERRKSPTQLQSNGMPATEWKLTEKHIEDSTETKMGRKPKFPPLEPATKPIEKRAVEIAVDRHNKATDLSEKLADVQRQLEIAEAANASWFKLAAEHECKSVPDLRILLNSLHRRIDELKAESMTQYSLIGEQRKQIAELNDQLMHGSEEAAEVKDAAFFAVHRPRRGLQRFKKLETAKAEAEVGARVEGQAELYAMFLVDVASKGAVWKGRQ